MKTKIIATLLLSFYLTSSFAFDAKKELTKVFSSCEKDGFLVCEEKYFYGVNRGLFGFLIEHEKLKKTENEFSEFLNNNFPKDDIKFYLLKVNLNFHLNINFNFEKLANSIKSVEKQDDFMLVTLKSGDMFGFIQEDGIWKLAIPDRDEILSRKNKSYQWYVMYRLKRNILEYHMEEAKLLKLNKRQVEKNVSEALAPIYIKVMPDENSPLILKWLFRDYAEVVKFYINFGTKEQMRNKIKKINGL